jgi:AcrR family transcriptional regulator
LSRKRSKRVYKSDWLAQALDILSKQGVEGVRVERLARDLDIAKSSFYWHFESRADLLKQVLDYWTYEYTSIVIGNQELRQLDPVERLSQVASMIFEYKLTKFDLSLRAWAENDVIVAEKVAKVFQWRMDYLRETFREIGFSGEELEMRTRLFACYHTWEEFMFWGEKNERMRLQKLQLKLLTMK